MINYIFLINHETSSEVMALCDSIGGSNVFKFFIRVSSRFSLSMSACLLRSFFLTNKSVMRFGSTSFLVPLFHWHAVSVHPRLYHSITCAYSILYRVAITWLQVSKQLLIHEHQADKILLPFSSVFLTTIQRARWSSNVYPQAKAYYHWKQPMFTMISLRNLKGTKASFHPGKYFTKWQP